MCNIKMTKKMTWTADDIPGHKCGSISWPS